MPRLQHPERRLRRRQRRGARGEADERVASRRAWEEEGTVRVVPRRERPGDDRRRGEEEGVRREHVRRDENRQDRLEVQRLGNEAVRVRVEYRMSYASREKTTRLKSRRKRRRTSKGRDSRWLVPPLRLRCLVQHLLFLVELDERLQAS